MYISAKEAARKWGISERRVRILCEEGRVDGVLRSSWAWNIPSDAPKPSDGRQLRHIKNHDLRIGGMDFSRLEEGKQALESYSNAVLFLHSYRHQVIRFILSVFAGEDLMITAQQLAVLFNQCFVPELQFEVQVLALNLRTLLNRLLSQYGLGPVPPKNRPPMSEQRLKELYQLLTQGLDDQGEYPYRTEAHADYTIDKQMQTLFIQYERDWMLLHPVVRSLFLYGELLRIKPYGRYDGLLAALALAQELLANGYPPAFVDIEHIDEFKAAMILTRSRGNYQNALRMLEQQLLFECTLLTSEE